MNKPKTQSGVASSDWLGGDMRLQEVRKTLLPHLRSAVVWENPNLPGWNIRLNSERMEAGCNAWRSLMEHLRSLGVDVATRMKRASDYN